MKPKIYISILIILIISCIIGCSSLESLKLKFGYKDINFEMDIKMIEKSKRKIPVGTFIHIRNDTDRNIELDFDGPSHYKISIGDKSTRVLNMEPGEYELMAAAPGLFYIPEKKPIKLEPHSRYKIIWRRVN